MKQKSDLSNFLAFWTRNQFWMCMFVNHEGRNMNVYVIGFKFDWIHGLRTPNEAFFHWNPERLGLHRQIGQINSGEFGIFSAKPSAVLVQWVPCPCFTIFNHYFYKKLILYIHIHYYLFIWDWDLNLGRKELGI